MCTVSIWVLRALAFAIDLQLELIADINIQQQRAGWRLISFITSTSAFGSHDFNASFILCQVSSCAWFSELEAKHGSENFYLLFIYFYINHTILLSLCMHKYTVLHTHKHTNHKSIFHNDKSPANQRYVFINAPIWTIFTHLNIIEHLVLTG